MNKLIVIKDESQEPMIPKLGIISYNQLVIELTCSRFFIESLVKKENLKKRYIGDKVFFLVEDVMKLLREDKLSA